MNNAKTQTVLRLHYDERPEGGDPLYGNFSKERSRVQRIVPLIGQIKVALPAELR